MVLHSLFNLLITADHVIMPRVPRLGAVQPLDRAQDEVPSPSFEEADGPNTARAPVKITGSS